MDNCNGDKEEVAGAVCISRPLSRTITPNEGNASVFAVLSRDISARLVNMGIITPSKHPKSQVIAPSDLRGVRSITELVEELEKILGGKLVEGTDFRVFTLPAAYPCGYFIAPGCCHFFLRGDTFQGAVLRLWWETNGVRDVDGLDNSGGHGDGDRGVVAATTAAPDAVAVISPSSATAFPPPSRTAAPDPVAVVSPGSAAAVFSPPRNLPTSSNVLKFMKRRGVKRKSATTGSVEMEMGDENVTDDVSDGVSEAGTMVLDESDYSASVCHEQTAAVQGQGQSKSATTGSVEMEMGDENATDDVSDGVSEAGTMVLDESDYSGHEQTAAVQGQGQRQGQVQEQEHTTVCTGCQVRIPQLVPHRSYAGAGAAAGTGAVAGAGGSSSTERRLQQGQEQEQQEQGQEQEHQTCCGCGKLEGVKLPFKVDPTTSLNFPCAVLSSLRRVGVETDGDWLVWCSRIWRRVWVESCNPGTLLRRSNEAQVVCGWQAYQPLQRYALEAIDFGRAVSSQKFRSLFEACGSHGGSSQLEKPTWGSDVSHLVPGLIIGDENQSQWLRQHACDQVDVIIDVWTGGFKGSFKYQRVERRKSPPLHYFLFPCSDSKEERREAMRMVMICALYVLPLLTVCVERKLRVFLHCRHGKNRSVYMAIMSAIFLNASGAVKWPWEWTTVDDVVEYVTNQRGIACLTNLQFRQHIDHVFVPAVKALLREQRR